MESSLYHRDLPNIVRELQQHCVAPDLATTDLYDDPALLFSAEGYGVCLVWLRNPETGELSLLDLLDNDMLAARETGLGGHASARDYFERLQELPAKPAQWSAAHKAEWDVVTAQARHLFLLAADAQLIRSPSTETTPEQTEKANERALYFCARTLAAGKLCDAQGAIVELPPLQLPGAEMFSELRWPRFYSCEAGIIRRESPDDAGSYLEAGAPLPHMADCFWGGLLRKSQVD